MKNKNNNTNELMPISLIYIDNFPKNLKLSSNKLFDVMQVKNDKFVFAYWDSHPSKFYKGTWKIQRLGKWDARIEINFDNWHTSTYIIENENELTDYIGDPDEYNRAVIRKKKE